MRASGFVCTSTFRCKGGWRWSLDWPCSAPTQCVVPAAVVVLAHWQLSSITRTACPWFLGMHDWRISVRFNEDICCDTAVADFMGAIAWDGTSEFPFDHIVSPSFSVCVVCLISTLIAARDLGLHIRLFVWSLSSTVVVAGGRSASPSQGTARLGAGCLSPRVTTHVQDDKNGCRIEMPVIHGGNFPPCAGPR